MGGGQLIRETGITTMKTKSSFFIVAFSVATLFSSGCKFFEFFKSDKKQIIRQIDRMKAGINNLNWPLVQSLMAKDFKWTSSDKITYKTKRRGKKVKEFGKIFFQESIDKLPKDRMAFYMNVKDIKKVTDTRYMVNVSSRLKIRKGAADHDNIMWDSLHTWVKIGDTWFVSSIKDVTQKVGNRNLHYYTNPVRKIKSRLRK